MATQYAVKLNVRHVRKLSTCNSKTALCKRTSLVTPPPRSTLQHPLSGRPLTSQTCYRDSKMHTICTHSSYFIIGCMPSLTKACQMGCRNLNADVARVSRLVGHCCHIHCYGRLQTDPDPITPVAPYSNWSHSESFVTVPSTDNSTVG